MANELREILAPFAALLPDGVVTEGRLGTDTSLALPGERESTSAMVEKRAHEFLTGRTCARVALRSFGVPDQLLMPGENRAPQWPSRFVGSISHTAGICVASVCEEAHYFGIGIDVERRDAVGEKLQKYIATPTEIERYDSRPRWRTIAFSAKESVFKAVNPATGLWLEFRDVELLEIGDATFLARVSPKEGPVFEIDGVYCIGAEYVFSAVTIARGSALADLLEHVDR